MARNQFHARWQLRQYFANIFRQTLNTTATLQVYKRKTTGKEVITHVHHIGGREEDNAIAVSVALRKVNDLDFFTIKVDRERLVEGNHRQCFLRRCRSRVFEELRPLFG